MNLIVVSSCKCDRRNNTLFYFLLSKYKNDLTMKFIIFLPFTKYKIHNILSVSINDYN